MAHLECGVEDVDHGGGDEAPGEELEEDSHHRVTHLGSPGVTLGHHTITLVIIIALKSFQDDCYDLTVVVLPAYEEGAQVYFYIFLPAQGTGSVILDQVSGSYR